jgi:hypothetical protein
VGPTTILDPVQPVIIQLQIVSQNVVATVSLRPMYYAAFAFVLKHVLFLIFSETRRFTEIRNPQTSRCGLE